MSVHLTGAEQVPPKGELLCEVSYRLNLENIRGGKSVYHLFVFYITT
ncbi:hypothetical protein EK904_013380 [Melospiza melodia maxima]|nr:hypothetical protein EK904_013380 [Melospiza melodia maxima]